MHAKGLAKYLKNSRLLKDLRFNPLSRFHSKANVGKKSLGQNYFLQLLDNWSCDIYFYIQ